MEKEVSGNIEGLKKSALEVLLGIYDCTVDNDIYCSQEIMDKICSVSYATGREIAVYIEKKGEICEVAVGDASMVRTNYDIQRGVRLIHTHPSGNACLSSIDISTLRSSDLAAMAAVSLDQDKMASMYCAYVATNGETEILGPYKNLSQTTAFMNELRLFTVKKQKTSVVTQGKKERVIAVGLSSKDSMPHMDELKSLIETAGGECVATMVQNKADSDPAFYIGKGKIRELMYLCSDHSADTVVFDDELTYSQQNNIKEEINVKVLDRTALILDIFAKRAFTNEGKLQVELAMLNYMLPRLMGQGTELSRLGGGIGTRGPGESKLETDRRVIKKRMLNLEKELAAVDKRRTLSRESKARKSFYTFAIAGYTNAGKSSLLNKLTQSDVLAEDMLFATLDPTARKYELPSGKEVILIDTVGFITKLPVKLIEAFKSTLDEIRFADCILHVMDGASEDLYSHVEEVYSILNTLGAANIPVIEVVNKSDLGKDLVIPPSKYQRVYISCKTGEGLDDLTAKMDEMQNNRYVSITVTVPYSNGKLMAFIYANAKVNATRETEEGTVMDIEISSEYLTKLNDQ
jgi:GTP-binding protein HflX